MAAKNIINLISVLTICALRAGGCDRRAKRGGEEPPHVRGQGQKPGGPHARRAAAKRSYPTSEVRGSSREYQTATAQERLRGATPCQRSWGAAKRRYPVTEIRGGGREDQPHVQEAVAARAQEGLEELSHVEGQEGWW